MCDLPPAGRGQHQKRRPTTLLRDSPWARDIPGRRQGPQLKALGIPYLELHLSATPSEGPRPGGMVGEAPREIFQERLAGHSGGASRVTVPHPSVSVPSFSLQPIHSPEDLSFAPHPPVDKRWSRAGLRDKAPARGVGLSPRWPTHRQDERNNHASSPVRLVYFGHFPSRERGRPGTPGASEELLGVPSRSVGETAATRMVTPAAPEKTRRVGRWEPPILPSSAAEPARLLRKFAVGAPGAIAWPPRSRAGAPEGRGQSELSRCPRSPTPLAARRL